MAQTTTVVANMALGLLGSKRIEDIEDLNDTLAVDCRFWLEQCIREIGVDHWNSMMALHDSVRDQADPAFGYSYRYQIPGDSLLVLKVNGYMVSDNTSSFTIDDPAYSQPYWKIFGGFIHTNDTVCKIEYVQYSAITSSMGGAMVAALACLMASYLAPTIRNDGGKRGDALRLRFEKILLPKARMRNGNERNRAPANVTDKSRLIGYRRYGTAPTGTSRS